MAEFLNIRVVVFAVLVFVFLFYLVNFLVDLFHFMKNGWNFEEKRKGSFDFIEGDPGGDRITSGKRRFILSGLAPLIIAVVIIFIFISLIQPIY